MNLEQKVQDRKAKLAALKASSQKKRPLEGNKNLRFRSYEPSSENLKKFMEEAPVIGVEANARADTVESRAEKIISKVTEEEAQKPEELVLGILSF
jgi:hypothetical protein